MSLIIINLLAVFFRGMLSAVTCVQVESLGEGDTVVLYLHGNSFNRSQSHRLGLYSLLLKLGYHVLAIGRVFRRIEKRSC
jgi:hypothetical protein